MHPGPGPLALVGSGEYLAVMAGVEGALIEGRPPRYVQIPTAAAPEGAERLQYWLDLGAAQAERLGVEQVPVVIRDRDEAGSADLAALIDAAGLIYLSGGNPQFLARTLRGTRVWAGIEAAWRSGAALAGCSAGAMILAGRHFDFRIRRMLFPLRWQDSLALVPKATVIPHYDAWPEALSAAFVLQSPRDLVTLGIDEDTAAVGRDGSWQVQGAGRVTVWRGRHRERFRRGDVFRI